jgi:transcriptional regulator with XRE-family HTH domain
VRHVVGAVRPLVTGAELTQLVIHNVDHLRETRGLTITEFIAAAHISRSYYFMLQKSRRAMSLQTLARMAMALDVHPAELLRTP